MGESGPLLERGSFAPGMIRDLGNGRQLRKDSLAGNRYRKPRPESLV